MDHPEQQKTISLNPPAKAAWRKRLTGWRAYAIGAVGLGIALLAVVYGLPFAARAANRVEANRPALVLQATTAPTIQATVTPMPQATAVPALAPNTRITPPESDETQPDGAVVGGANACAPTVGLPVYSTASCLNHDSKQEDGATSLEETYTTPAAVDDVRHFYETAFAQNGWKVVDSGFDAQEQSWRYTVMQGQRTIIVQIESQGTGAKIDIDETTVGSAAATCTNVAGLPIYTNATCIKNEIDRDDSPTDAEDKYFTPASVDDVQRFYNEWFLKNGWTISASNYDPEDQQWDYTVVQLRHIVTLKIEAHEADQGAGTEIKIEEQ